MILKGFKFHIRKIGQGEILKAAIIAMFFLLFMFYAEAQNININGPVGSGQFGTSVTVLPNGNYVVTDPLYDAGAIKDVGAVYLYNGSTHTLISNITGSKANDNVGIGGITVLSNGNYLISSYNWANGTATKAGAVTLCSAVTGIQGVINNFNSLMGTKVDDKVGIGGIVELSNGNYVVSSPNWGNGTSLYVGAATWCKGTGRIGTVTTTNSLVGSTTNDAVGGNITPLANGNYVVESAFWDNAGVVDAGAVTWCNGSTGLFGAVTTSNSLVGTKYNDLVGYGRSKELTNGNYIVLSHFWGNGTAYQAGSVTWCNGTTGRTGVVSATNSLVGSTAGDDVGYSVSILSNGNYVVNSYQWDNGIYIDAGAVTWCNGTSGRIGTVSGSNSLVGTKSNDKVGLNAYALPNGNYLVKSSFWGNGSATNAGAVTWCDGTTGRFGAVSSTNSLVGSQTDDKIGDRIIVLPNSNFITASYNWSNGSVKKVGAVTWLNGTSGRTGVVSSSNSLIGSQTNDAVGSNDIIVLTNGNYVIASPNWANGTNSIAGAVTWCNGTSGRTGIVSSSNSLVGNKPNDNVGYRNIDALTNGNYVVSSYNWNNGTVLKAGAVTWGNGNTGTIGVVSSSNSLVGSKANDQVGSISTELLSNGNYVVKSVLWDNGSITDAGAVTWGNGCTGISGPVTTSNSLVGTSVSDRVGYGLSIALPNGNYVVGSNMWQNGTVLNAGAVTWGNGNTGTIGVVSSSNSLVGSKANDQIGAGAPSYALPNGDYYVKSTFWDNGTAIDVGAVTLGNGSIGVSGVIKDCNSVIGNSVPSEPNLRVYFNSVYDYMIVARKSDNKVTILRESILWTGEFNNQWHDVRNWCSKTLPISTTVVEIASDATNMPVISTNAIAKTIVVNAGASLSITESGSLSVNSGFNNMGTLENKGRIKLNGTTPQTFPGSGFVTAMSELEISNNSGVTLNKSISLSSYLIPTTGTLNLGNFDITLLSEASKTASVTSIGLNADIAYGTGRFVVQRYIATGAHGKGWQFLSSPLKEGQTIFNSWQNSGLTSSGKGTLIYHDQYNGTNGFDVGVALSPTIKSYNYSNNDWTVYPNNTNSTYLDNPHGYLLFVRGDRNVVFPANPTSPTVLSNRGKIYTRAAGFSPNSVTVFANKYGSIGNPYASQIDFTSLNRIGGIDNKFYVWDPKLYGAYNLGGYQVISAATGWKPVPGSSYYPAATVKKTIESGQAFLVYSTATTGAIAFSESAKSLGSNLVNRPEENSDIQILRANLFSDNNEIADGNAVVFNSTFSNEIDSDDANKIQNSGENFGILRSTKLLAIEARSPVVLNDTIFYNLKKPMLNRTYNLVFESENIDTELNAELIDSYTGTRNNVSLNAETSVPVSFNQDPNSTKADRFMLVLKRGVTSPLPVNFISVSAIKNNKNIKINWTVANEINVENYIVERSKEGRSFEGIASALPNNSNAYVKIDDNPFAGNNFYRIKAVSNNGFVQYSSTVKVSVEKLISSISVYPNPLVNNYLNIHFVNQTKGKYSLRVLNTLGQLVYSGTEDIFDNNVFKNIEISKLIAKGVYKLLISKPDGSTESIKVVVN